MNGPKESAWMFLRVALTAKERARLDEVCGPGRPMKRGAWVRQAIVEKLGQEKTRPRAGRPAANLGTNAVPAVDVTGR